MPTPELVKSIGGAFASMAIAFDQHPTGAMMVVTLVLVVGLLAVLWHRK